MLNLKKNKLNGQFSTDFLSTRQTYVYEHILMLWVLYPTCTVFTSEFSSLRSTSSSSRFPNCIALSLISRTVSSYMAFDATIGLLPGAFPVSSRVNIGHLPGAFPVSSSVIIPEPDPALWCSEYCLPDSGHRRQMMRSFLTSRLKRARTCFKEYNL
jgi:hypothetical protein